MKTAEDYAKLGEELNRLLILRYSPIAMKLLYDESEIPEGSRRTTELAGHIAMCQAYGMVRRQRLSVTMLKEDHWCVWPLVSFGICDIDSDDEEYMGSKFFFKDPAMGVKHLRETYPKLKSDKKPIGFSLAPLEKVNFVPDLITIYCRPAQLRSIMMAARFNTGEMFNLSLDSVDSCVNSSIPVLNGQEFNITVPDPGEYERALCDEDEMMFTSRPESLFFVKDTLASLSQFGMGYKELHMELSHDYARPKFYNDMFEKWGLPRGEDWKVK
ncbi:MAG: DUF169 domain-containing protein [Lachnospiraceae bacterium]|nr:DUF169 domain-containing protein [Lachnospiraceae bacterium]